jgi:lantibiotic leader peptide-processing serine protease
MNRAAVCSVAVLMVAGLAATTSAQGRPRRYIVISKSETAVSAALMNQIRGAGGRVVRDMSPMGLVSVATDNPNFASSIPDAVAVAPDMHVSSPRPRVFMGPDLVSSDRVPGPPNSTNDDPFLNLQWGITAVDAQNAWAHGRKGAGAIVAILDEGVDATHPDLAPNVRADLSTSFAEDCSGSIEDWQPPPGFYFNHGTHVAGIVAAADNGFGVIGVAPKAQIMAVDVLSRCLGYGLDSWIIDGIRYAADHGADVINMSLGSGPLDTRGACDDAGNCYTAEDIRNTAIAYSRAALHANRKGATVIASAGNDGFDFGANPQFIQLPSDALGILSISATAPIGWAVDPTVTLDNPASYSNFGTNRIDFSAPGGDFAYPGNEGCTVAGLARPCWVFDLVFSDIPGGWAWAAGTSMAAPHAAGVAAQYIGASGGKQSPLVVEGLLRLLADHPNGNRRRDPFYGYGRVDTTILDPRP